MVNKSFKSVRTKFVNKGAMFFEYNESEIKNAKTVRYADIALLEGATIDNVPVLYVGDNIVDKIDTETQNRILLQKINVAITSFHTSKDKLENFHKDLAIASDSTIRKAIRKEIVEEKLTWQDFKKNTLSYPIIEKSKMNLDLGIFEVKAKYLSKKELDTMKRAIDNIPDSNELLKTRLLKQLNLYTRQAYATSIYIDYLNNKQFIVTRENRKANIELELHTIDVDLTKKDIVAKKKKELEDKKKDLELSLKNTINELTSYYNLDKELTVEHNATKQDLKLVYHAKTDTYSLSNPEDDDVVNN